ncbi:MAG TPA: methyltransferase domain-containing protein [Flavisolibacter sp.]|nr:methyltransferase domain-containing protein [Flavisolibacter sp.]
MDIPLILQQFNFGEESIPLLVPDPAHIKKQFLDGPSLPYWSQVWPAAIALTGFVLHNPGIFKEKRVLELAAGLGLPSMAAAKYARSVLCSDLEAEAMLAAKRSAEEAGLNNLRCLVLDWNNLPGDLDADIVLLSDVNYDPAAFNTLRHLIEVFLQKGALVILSTPERLVAKDFVAPLLSYCTSREQAAIKHGGTEVGVTLFVLQCLPPNK